MKAADTLAREYFGGSREEIGATVFDEFVALIETDREEHRESLRDSELRQRLFNLVNACRSHRISFNSDETALQDAIDLLALLAMERRDE